MVNDFELRVVNIIGEYKFCLYENLNLNEEVNTKLKKTTKGVLIFSKQDKEMDSKLLLKSL